MRAETQEIARMFTFGALLIGWLIVQAIRERVTR